MSIQAGRATSRYLFIDGSYLRKEYEKLLNHLIGRVPPIEFTVVKAAFHAHKAFYYDGLDEIAEGESQQDYEARLKPQLELLSKIRSIPGFHVYEGSIRGKKGRRRQKKVDVQLTVDALTHAFRQNADEIVLLAGDLDFEPLVAALIQLGTYVTIAAVPESISTEFAFSGDHYRKLDVDSLLQFAGPQEVKVINIPGETQHSDLLPFPTREIARGTYLGQQVLLYEDIRPERSVKKNNWLLISVAGESMNRLWAHPDAEFLKKYVTAKVPDIIWE